MVMAKIKQTQRRKWELDLKENEYWQNELIDYFQNNENPDEILNYLNWVDELTADDIKNAANEFLGENIVQVVLLPESENNE
jgi:zinc protease